MSSLVTIDDLELHVDERGTGRTVVVIHGGGGPATVAPIAEHVALTAHTLTPILPGWDGTGRPDGIRRVEDIADRFARWFDVSGLHDVVLIGSSIGGWIASELAVRDLAVRSLGRGRIRGLVLLDAVGFDIPEEPIRDFFALDARGVAECSWHDSERYYVDPGTLSKERTAAMAANMAALRLVAGDPYMVDPGLRTRVREVTIPVLAIWGESDRIVTPEYGRAVVASFGNGRLAPVAEAGHLPHIEQPGTTLKLIDRFLADLPG